MMTTRSKQDDEMKVLRDDSECTVYWISNDDGDVLMASYHVFPGIDLIYNDVHTRWCATYGPRPGNIFEINHCKEGRIECESGGSFFYISQGDMSIGRKQAAGQTSYFPGGHYHGITVSIDADRAPDSLSRFLTDVDINPVALISRFDREDNGLFIVREKPALEHVFSELYSVPDEIRKGYLKVKVLEILLFLSYIETEGESPSHAGVPKSQVVLAKRVCRHLTENMDKRITLDQLSEYFHVSPTMIKSSFKGVYGTSMYAFVRAEKMRQAALLLRKTDRTILDIASEFGYDNGSKFAKAFQDVMGESPSEHRRLASENNKLQK